MLLWSDQVQNEMENSEQKSRLACTCFWLLSQTIQYMYFNLIDVMVHDTKKKHLRCTHADTPHALRRNAELRTQELRSSIFSRKHRNLERTKGKQTPVLLTQFLHPGEVFVRRDLKHCQKLLAQICIFLSCFLDSSRVGKLDNCTAYEPRNGVVADQGQPFSPIPHLWFAGLSGLVWWIKRCHFIYGTNVNCIKIDHCSQTRSASGRSARRKVQAMQVWSWNFFP